MENKKQKSVENYLDYIPVHSDRFTFDTDDTGKVTIFQENNKPFDWILQLIANKPKVSQIHLDTMGSFIWTLMDGENTVYSISRKVSEHFGETAEPLYDRLVKYIQILESYGFIRLVGKSEK